MSSHDSRPLVCSTFVLLVGVLLGLPAPAAGQAPPTAADYQRAERLLAASVNPLVLGSGIRANWMSGDRFWYQVTTERGREFVLVDPARAAKTPAFDQARVAAALSAASKASYAAFDLPFTTFTYSGDEQSISFRVGRQGWTCDAGGRECRTTGEDPGSGDARSSGPPQSVSPDGSRAVFIRDHNLWVRELTSGRETALTTDGVKDYGYATDNAGWIRSERPVVVWSPDSRKVATFRHDGRLVGDMQVVDTRVGHANLQVWKYPLPGDEHIFMIERVVIDVESGAMVRLQMPPDAHRSSLCDHVVCGGQWADVQWSPDSRQLAFVSTSRDHRHTVLRVADVGTGAVRDVLEERVETFFESGNGGVNWRVLAPSNEVLWFSQRSDWGHLYLYDLQTGRLKHQVTSGEGNVTRVLRVDEAARQLYFLGVGKEWGRDPYLAHLYRVDFDGGNLTLLTPEDANHQVQLSESGRYFVDSHSRPEVPPTTLLRDATGRLVMALETADVSRLSMLGWKPPMPIVVKARDGVTDLYGLMYTPSRLDPSRKYPIVNRVYPGPQTGSVGGRSFSAARGDSQALAELGFIVVEIDGMGTPWRSKTFHEAYYGDMGDNTIPDQVAGMKQLAERFPYIDLDRAGIWGHSGGGYAAAAAMFKYPEFFKVGVAQAGNHDNRNYEDDWAEKWQGLLVPTNGDKASNYDSQANQNFAKNLKGKLLLAHGTMDTNVPVSNTLLVVDALIAANKDFDLLLLPNRGHGFSNEPYMMRRRWDYFVRHLMGVSPPEGYEVGASR